MLQPKIDSQNAPPWARYWACDADGESFWYEAMPYPSERTWVRSAGRTKLAEVQYSHELDWRKSLTSIATRPSEPEPERGWNRYQAYRIERAERG